MESLSSFSYQRQKEKVSFFFLEPARCAAGRKKCREMLKLQPPFGPRQIRPGCVNGTWDFNQHFEKQAKNHLVDHFTRCSGASAPGFLDTFFSPRHAMR
jgi:hypothetical protein